MVGAADAFVQWTIANAEYRRQLQIGFGDIVWLPEGTALKYIARERVGYFYALYPVDWAQRQGTVEP